MKKKIVKRALALVCCLSLTLGMFAYRPPKAKAVVTETAALGAAATVCVVDYSTAMMVFSGMKTGAATSSVIGLMDTYAAATGVAASGTALASTIATGILVAGGTLLVGAAAAALIGGFIDWLREDQGIEAGGEVLDLSYPTGKYLYNGYEGPAFPPYDKDKYPYVIFLRNATLDELQFWVLTNKPQQISYSGFRYSGKFQVWVDGVLDTEYSYSTASQVNRQVYWANFSNAGGVAHDDPIPVTEGLQLQPKEEIQEFPDAIPEGQVMVISPGIAALPQDDPQAAADAIMQSAIDGALAPTVSIEADPTITPGPEPEPNPDPEGGADADSSAITGWLSRILEGIKALPQQIGEAISSIFTPDPELVAEITGTFSEKFGFVDTLKTIGDDLFGMDASTEPPVVWIHLEDAEGRYNYGGTVKALDMSWYQRYKEDMDRIFGGFLWIAYLWLLFKRVPDIISGAGMVAAESQYIGEFEDGNGGRFRFRRSKRL